MNKKKLLIIAAIVVLVAVLVYVQFTSDTAKTTEVQAEEAANRELVENVSASGRIQPQTRVNITAEVTGEIVALKAKEGDHVEVGQSLIVLDTVSLRALVDQARYALTESEARLEGARATFDQAEEE